MTTGNESGSYVISYMDNVLLIMNVLCSGDLRVGMMTGAVSMVTVSYLVISACAVSSGGTLASLSSAMTQDNLFFFLFSTHKTACRHNLSCTKGADVCHCMYLL